MVANFAYVVGPGVTFSQRSSYMSKREIDAISSKMIWKRPTPEHIWYLLFIWEFDNEFNIDTNALINTILNMVTNVWTQWFTLSYQPTHFRLGRQGSWLRHHISHQESPHHYQARSTSRRVHITSTRKPQPNRDQVCLKESEGILIWKMLVVRKSNSHANRGHYHVSNLQRSFYNSRYPFPLHAYMFFCAGRSTTEWDSAKIAT